MECGIINAGNRIALKVITVLYVLCPFRRPAILVPQQHERLLITNIQRLSSPELIIRIFGKIIGMNLKSRRVGILHYSSIKIDVSIVSRIAFPENPE